MRYPSILSKSARRVTVPQLSGGVNAADNPSQIADNQLTQCNNMYFDMGRLRTRPGARYAGNQPVASPTTVLNTGSGLFLHNADGKMSFIDCQNGEVSISDTQYTSALNFDQSIAVNVNGSQCSNAGVLIIGDKEEGLQPFNVFRSNSTAVIAPQSIYIPTVLINSIGSQDPMTYTVTGTAFEGYNMLTDSYSILATAGTNKCWHLPRKPTGGELITVTLTDPQYGKIVHSLSLPEVIDTTDSAVGRYITDTGYNASYLDKTANTTVTYLQKIMYNARENCIMFMAKKGEQNYTPTVIPMSVGSYKNSSSNMKITVLSSASQTAEKILGMKSFVWFGGVRGGLGGGTRLFAAGNPDCSGAIYWSDLNKPTYFSENNYAYVGDSSNINALAQQDDMLVVFQDNAITVSKYVQGQTLSADSIIAGETIDVTAVAATFPLTPVHSTIGCDCPDTIQLCSNRLVWLTSNGRVYTLVNYSQYSERNVREISYAIAPMLKRHTADELKNAKSADVAGRYCLFIGNKVYLLDYEDKTIGKGSVWYVWSLPKFMSGVSAAFVQGDILVLIDGQAVYTIDFNTAVTRRLTDNDGEAEHPIGSSFTTKLFNFGGGERLKRVNSITLGVGKTVGEINVSSVISGCTEDIDTLLINEEGGVQYETLYPDARSVTDFGIEVRSDSAMSVESVSIIYRETGDIK